MHILKKLEKNLEKIGKNLEKISPVGGGGGAPPPPPPDPKLLKGMPQIHAQFVENESKMSKITHYPHPPEISGSTPDHHDFNFTAFSRNNLRKVAGILRGTKVPFQNICLTIEPIFCDIRN